MKNLTMIDFLKRNKVEFFIGFTLLILLLIESRGRGDFQIFLDASRDLFEGKNIYKIQYNEWYYYYYDTLFALIISPLQLIPLFWAKFIWLLFNLLFTFRIWKIILSYLPIDILTIKQKRIHTIISFIIILMLWHKNIHLSQMTIFILYLCLEGLNLIYNKKLFLGSFLIGMGISIKILPLVLIPYFLYRGNFKVTLYILLSIILALGIPVIFIGYDYSLFLLQERWSSINPLNQEHIIDVSERSFHSLTTLLSILLVDGVGNQYSLELKRNFANVDIHTLKIIINVVRSIFIIGTLYFIHSLPFKKAQNKLQIFYELSYIFLIIPLIFPHQQHYAFFFVFPAISYLVFYFIAAFYSKEPKYSRFQRYSFIIIFIIIYFLLNSNQILGTFNNIYDHFKTLTFGVILLIPLLIIAKPNKI